MRQAGKQPETSAANCEDHTAAEIIRWRIGATALNAELEIIIIIIYYTRMVPFFKPVI